MQNGEERLLKDTIATTSSINERSRGSSQHQVFVIGKSYAGLLSGCIAVDKQQFQQRIHNHQ